MRGAGGLHGTEKRPSLSARPPLAPDHQPALYSAGCHARVFLPGLSNIAQPERHNGSRRTPRRRRGESAMQYMMLLYRSEGLRETAGKAEMDQMTAACGAYTEAVKNAGILVGGDRLDSAAAASTVRIAD